MSPKSFSCAVRTSSVMLDTCVTQRPQLRERKRGYFSWGGRAFLHFHEDAGDYYVDVKLDSRFQRVKVTSRSDQALLLTRVKEALRSNGRPAA
jgi:hypothetical protein